MPREKEVKEAAWEKEKVVRMAKAAKKVSNKKLKAEIESLDRRSSSNMY